MSSMVPVTRKEYHVFVDNMSEAFGEENVVDAGSQWGNTLPHMIVVAHNVNVAAMHFEEAGGNGALSFLDISYLIDSGYLSWRDEDDHSQEDKPTSRDTVTPFAVTDDDMKKPAKPRILPMRNVPFETFNEAVKAALAIAGDKIEEVLNHERDVDIPNTCYVYNGQIAAQVFHATPYYGAEPVIYYLLSPTLRIFSHLGSKVGSPK